MNLAYYNQEVDKILWDMIGNDSFLESDLESITDTITETIYIYDKQLIKSKLKIIIQILVENKYQKCFVYNINSEFNQIQIPKTQNVNKTDSEFMTINASDLDEDINNSCQYTNPELASETTDKIQLSSYEDLVSHRHDYLSMNFEEEIYLKRYQRVNEIKKIPQHEQKSKEWLEQRNQCLQQQRQ